jgi:hypothetical protein
VNLSRPARAALLLLASLLLLAATASAAAAASVGQFFAVSPSGMAKELQSFSIAPSGELTLEDSEPLTYRFSTGVTVARIASGTYVYALEEANGLTAEINEFKLDLATGKLTPIGQTSVEFPCGFPTFSNQLFAFDSGAEGTAQVIAPTCHLVSEVGYFPAVNRFPIDPTTGVLGTPVSYIKGPTDDAVGLTLTGNELTWAWDYLGDGKSAEQTNLEFFYFNRETGGLEPVGEWSLSYGNEPKDNQQAFALASEPGWVGYGVGPQSKEDPIQGIGAIPFGGQLPSVGGETAYITDLAYGNEGLFGVEQGPQLQTFAKDGAAAFGPTTALPGIFEPYSVFALGEFIYASDGGITQLTDRTGLPVTIDASPSPHPSATESVNVDVTGMTGFLFKEGEGGESGGGSGGEPGGGTPTGPSTPSAPLTPGLGPTKPAASIGLTASKKAKLAAGKLKLKVDCSAACVVSGAVGKGKGLPFKPVKLPGGGTSTVTLPFTAAQRKLLHADLGKGAKPDAKVTVTEPGSAPKSLTIAIV